MNDSDQASDRGRSTRADVIFSVEQLRKRFGGIVAVDGVSFEVERGTMTGLIGPNGAGKSTVFNLATGFNRPDSGRVYFEDEDVTGAKPYQCASKGLVRTFQIAHELSQLTVLENVKLAPQRQLGESFWYSVAPFLRRRVTNQEANVHEESMEILEFFAIDHLAEERAANLSGGQRKLLALARAIMTEPDMLLLDEPFAGVNPTLQKRLLERLHELCDQGYTILLIEHDMDIIMENCQRIIVMHQGSVLSSGTAAEIKDDEAVLEAYLGGSV